MKNFKTYTISDVVEAIKSSATVEQEDYIIAGLAFFTTVSGVFLSASGIDVTTISGYLNDGTGYWDYTVTSGSEADVASWRLENYADTYRQAYRSLDFNVYTDNYTTISGREDMEVYDNLHDASNSTGINITYSGTETYLQVEYPDDRTTNLIRLYIDDEDARCYFAHSKNNEDWSYLAATTGDHTVTSGTLTLTEYATISGANEAYVDLDAGSNRLNLPEGIQIKYGRVYFTSATENTVKVSDYSWTEQIYFDDISAGSLNTGLITITSPDGRTTFDGNTITVRDENGTVRVRIGYLG